MVRALLLLSLLLCASVSLTLASEQTVGGTPTDKSASATTTNSAEGTPTDTIHNKLVDNRTDAADGPTGIANSTTSKPSTSDSSPPVPQPGVFDAAPFSEPPKNLSTNSGSVRTETASSQPTSGTNNTVPVTSPPTANTTRKSASSPQNKPSGSTLYGFLLALTVAGIQLFA